MLSGLMSRWMTPRSCARESVGDVPQRAARLVDRQRAVIVYALGEIVARDVRHHEEDEPFQFIDGVDIDDVRMVELRRRLRFAQEAGFDLAAKRELGRKDLDGDCTLQASVFCAIDHAHSAAPDLRIQFVVRAEHTFDVGAQLRIRVRRSYRLRQAIRSGLRARVGGAFT